MLGPQFFLSGIVVTVFALWWLWPPKFALRGWLKGSLVLLLIMPLLGLLPVAWMGVPAWRLELEEAMGASLGGYVTPQPFLLVRQYLIYASGLMFLWWIAGQGWSGAEERIFRPAGAIFLMLISGALAFARWDKARWQEPFASELGAMFSTRNQASMIGALAVIAALAYALSANRGHRWRVSAWLVGGAMGMVALFSLGSRGGLLAAGVGGAVALGLLSWWTRRTLPMVVFAIGMAGGVSILLLGGTQTGQRLVGLASRSETFRWEVQADAWRMIGDNPFVGVGWEVLKRSFRFFVERWGRVIVPGIRRVTGFGW